MACGKLQFSATRSFGGKEITQSFLTLCSWTIFPRFCLQKIMESVQKKKGTDRKGPERDLTVQRG